MSEQVRNNPEKEAKPMFDDCSRCEQKYQLTFNNSFLVTFEKQPEMNYLYCQCPNCDFRTKIFVGDESAEQARLNGLRENPTYTLADGTEGGFGGEWADDETYSEWIELRGIELPKTYELTDRHEREIAKFGETLVAMYDYDPGLITQALTDPAPPQTMPQRWTDG